MAIARINIIRDPFVPIIERLGMSWLKDNLYDAIHFLGRESHSFVRKATITNPAQLEYFRTHKPAFECLFIKNNDLYEVPPTPS